MNAKRLRKQACNAIRFSKPRIVNVKRLRKQACNAIRYRLAIERLGDSLLLRGRPRRFCNPDSLAVSVEAMRQLTIKQFKQIDSLRQSNQ